MLFDLYYFIPQQKKKDLKKITKAHVVDIRKDGNNPQVVPLSAKQRYNSGILETAMYILSYLTTFSVIIILSPIIREHYLLFNSLEVVLQCHVQHFLRFWHLSSPNIYNIVSR